ncbi:MAG TPA: NAD(P)H-binding protein [Polyangiaceae bacterium]|jgi:putative NADH-flavin reductase
MTTDPSHLGHSRRLFVLGATGRTGVELLDLALARGHSVTAFVRSPGKITRRDGRLAVVEGRLDDAGSMASAMAGHDAVVSVLGPTPWQGISSGTTLMRDSTVTALEAMERARVKRLLVVSSALLFPESGPALAFFRWLISHHIQDLRAMETALEKSGTDWTAARPPRLVMTRDEAFTAADGAFPGRLSAGISMSWRAVAAFLVDAVERGLHARQVVGVSC